MSLVLGPLLFATPLALIALIGLPLLWFVLRATPPQPQEQVLPSFALFEDLAAKEETPDKTPWWIILLRLLIATLAIIGLATPIWSPPKTTPEFASTQNVLMVIDNGWTSAPGWSSARRSALSVLDGLDRDQAVYVVTTTGTDFTDDLAERLTPQTARGQIQALRPQGWLPDLTPLSEALQNLPDGQFRSILISDGQRHDAFDALTDVLRDIGPVEVIANTDAPQIAITQLATTAKGPELTLIRSNATAAQSVSLSAFDETGRSLASATADFSRGDQTTEMVFDVPEALQADMSWFAVNGATSAGGIWQWEGADRVRRVGLLSEGQSMQPLLSDTYYVRKALAPFANVIEGSLTELLDDELNVLILTDVGDLLAEDETRLQEWIEDGGVLVRFAGPRLAAQADSLLPVRLRRSSRALDSALSWDTPQALTGFPDASPFAPIMLDPDKEVLIRRQVLAQPDPELASRTWARLADGTPLVTSQSFGQGRLTLFHVTAGPDWSDLPLSGVFVEMLRRATLPSRELGQIDVQPNTSLAPQRWLNGFGDFIPPAPNAAPIQIEDLTTLKPTAEHPAGLYEGSAVTLPLNAGDGWQPAPVTNWPSGFTVRTSTEQATRKLAGWFLGSAFALLLADLIISLILAGRLRFGKAASAALLINALALPLLTPPSAHAQTEADENATMEAALNLRFGYLVTQDSETNRKAEAGLLGLSITLYRRTTVEPETPVGLNLTRDPLNLYPFILVVMPQGGIDLEDDERAALAQYLRNGGALVIDTATGGSGSAQMASDQRIARFLDGLDIPQLLPVDDDHVLTRSFYLLDGFNGRYPDRPLWVESGKATSGDERRGDGISSIFITDADMSAAWASDMTGRPLFSVDGGQRSREMAYRTGVNIVMYILTGTYKDDQVHLPSLLERLGEVTDTSDRPALRTPEEAAPTDITPPDNSGRNTPPQRGDD
ncbi:MAG: hypothetical protein CMK07_15920 [Ponticaulis sp.]|nr:hypothetical protein [Ponticaulis sp.]